MGKSWVLLNFKNIRTEQFGTKLTDYKSLEKAKKEFLDQYYEKTGNYWDERSNFEKKPKKFFPIELDYGTEEDIISKLLEKQKEKNEGVKSKLDRRVRECVKLFFDIKEMVKQLVELEIDTKVITFNLINSRKCH
jgi:poly [ADP-ribose] polymerase 1